MSQKIILTRPLVGCILHRPQVETSAGQAGLRLFVLAICPIALLLGLLVVTAGVRAADLPVLQPVPNTHDAPITSSILVSFARVIDPTTVSTRAITIHSVQQGLVTGTYALSKTQVLLTPAPPFFPGELVQGVVTTHTQALTGTALVVPAVWQFRTAVGAGSGTFVQRPSGLDSTWSEDIALGDLDGDGDLDIFLGHRDAASTLWFNDGAGQFTTNGLDLGSDFLIDVALGDLDGDGDLDALLAGIQDNSLWRNDGHGLFRYDDTVFVGSPIIRRVGLGDLDGDGDLDAVTAAACDPFDPNQACTYAAHRIWWNNGAGGLQVSSQSLGHGTAADVALGDLDEDGDLDALIVSPLAQSSVVWTNLGSGVFTRTQTLDSLAAASVDFGDLDGDGDLDAFVAAQASATSAVWLNVGNGTLVPGQHLGNLGPATLGDLDGDGDLDAFSVNAGADKIWLNQGDATFMFSGQALGRATSTNVALGDVDGDGDLDAVTSGYDTEPSLWVSAQADHRLYLPLIHTVLTVTTSQDELNSDGDCSLREAIQAANTDERVDQCLKGEGADVILLPAGTYTLTLAGAHEDGNLTGDLDITGSVTLLGGGERPPMINGNQLDRVLQIHANANVYLRFA